ncbi:hypothetical protein BDN70DRAFT_251104 [Pholiota conissans]|uniref:Uncharacterized protein n=1 Tax=Pholiota conissans TaxID=109636 RepID=A0A9P6CW75_9AGAR|nr:hypothetical protein BDN70DRAFT_251104 [Pholiota conissans]
MQIPLGGASLRRGNDDASASCDSGISELSFFRYHLSPYIIHRYAPNANSIKKKTIQGDLNVRLFSETLKKGLERPQRLFAASYFSFAKCSSETHFEIMNTTGYCTSIPGFLAHLSHLTLLFSPTTFSTKYVSASSREKYRRSAYKRKSNN